MLVLLASGLASYAAAMLRATPAAEVSTADSGMLRLVAWTGLALIANDGIPNGARLEVLLRRVVRAGAVVAILGIVQFVTGTTFVDGIGLPGFSSTQEFAGVQERAGFVRSVGTAIHPLEYSAILTMVLPLAVTQGLEKRGSLVARWWPAGVIAAASAVAVSRSTMLCLAAGLLVMALTWTPTVRRWMAAAAAAGATAVFVLVPGMAGVVLSLFTTLSGDSSALSRSDSFDLVWTFFERSAVFGRGFATFLPEYRILDNQYLLTVVEMGIVGLVASSSSSSWPSCAPRQRAVPSSHDPPGPSPSARRWRPGPSGWRSSTGSPSRRRRGCSSSWSEPAAPRGASPGPSGTLACSSPSTRRRPAQTDRTGPTRAGARLAPVRRTRQRVP